DRGDHRREDRSDARRATREAILARPAAEQLIPTGGADRATASVRVPDERCAGLVEPTAAERADNTRRVEPTVPARVLGALPTGIEGVRVWGHRSLHTRMK